MFAFFLILLLASPAQGQNQPLIAHEWGTITTRHLPNGLQVGGLNKISPDELLPDFVHRFEPPQSNERFSKTATGVGHPDVTMRLETPVLYFYPADAKQTQTPVTVQVRLRGGLLNEFYPGAVASAEFDSARVSSKSANHVMKWDGVNLANYLDGRLTWKDLRLGATDNALPKTKMNVWLAPRGAARATPVATPSGETERFVFYRGVAHLPAMLATEVKDGKLLLKDPDLMFLLMGNQVLPHVWVAWLSGDGKAGSVDVGPVTVNGGHGATLATVDVTKPQHDASVAGLAELRASMKANLISGGLFEDEAEAMLKTWEGAYFKTPGLRVFYIVPVKWMDTFLPLSLSVPAAVTRVFVGRIDQQI